MSGYLLTREGPDALALFETSKWEETGEGVRFAATLSDGQGFAAFDGPAVGFMERGTVFITQGFVHPFFVPKRWRGSGRECFSLMSDTFAGWLAEQETVTGVARVHDDLLLVESDGPILAGSGWSASVVTYRDKRLVEADA